MTPGRPKRVMPIRRWLALALPIIFLTPILGSLIVAFAWVRVPQFSRFAAEEQLQENASRWHDPAWREATAAELAAQGVTFVLMEDGEELFRSRTEPIDTGPPGALVQRVEVKGSDPALSALVYGELRPTAYRRTWLIPLVGISLSITILAGMAWFLGRALVRPLAATSDAARQVAGGNLDVRLPSSRVREVAELTAAFDTMQTALKTSVEHEARLEEERRLFISAVVHDLRTPLFSLRGSLEGLAQGVANTPEKVDHYVTVAREKAGTLERLIADLFAYTRLEYLEQPPRQERLDLTSLVRNLLTGVESLSTTRGITLVLRAPTRPVQISGDAHLLTRAIENLLDNALRYTPKGGTVTVEISRRRGACQFAVADTGPGIPPDQMDQLFAPLYRGEDSRNRRTGGAGLGLTVARRILTAHGGSLTAANRPEGGAIFMGTLPLDHGDASA